MPNRLERETSPYLLQHAANPVDWYPWGEEALARSRELDRPILLSIGYSACHWCHVMERESFEDEGVAELMNGRFVNVKVDREERPDVDQIYMKAVQAMTGSGGWPLTVFLTPDAVPYYGGTYFPPEQRHGMPSFRQVLRAAADAYEQRGDEVRAAGDRLVAALRRTSVPDGAPSGPGAEVLDSTYRTLAKQYDGVHGGFGRAPKFPQPVTIELLLRHHVRTGERAALDMALHTLRRMAGGGLRDHLGGGFHRYSVDARWLVPHFEKMLYDNALLARAYLDAWRLTGAADLRATVESTLDWIATDMRDPGGGFYSARDADSEGEEGLYYLWSLDEVRAELGVESAGLFARCYDVTARGNFEGRNILHLPHDLASVAASEGVTADVLDAQLARSRAALLSARATREEPLRDEKVLVSWSAMALRAFAEAGASLARPDYIGVATSAADFLWRELRPDGRLLHTWKDGRASIAGFLDDHAALGNALLSLHAASHDARWLHAARTLCDEILEHFLDPADGVLYDTSSDAEPLVVRPRDPMDNATPSGTSLAAELLWRAGQVFGDDRYRSASTHILRAEAGTLARYGTAFGRLLSVLDRTLAEPVEVAIVGPRDDALTDALVGAAHATFLADAVLVGAGPGEPVEGIPLLQGRGLREGRPTAYVCRRYACRLPVTTPEALREEISALDAASH